jgi:hypothetical protein
MKVIAFAIGLLSLGCLVAVAPSHADPGRGAVILCYVWANNPSPTIGTPYTPSSLYSYNEQTRAAGNSVTKTTTGTYTVTCKGVGGGAVEGGGSWGAGGHVEVSAYGAGNPDTCHVGGWSTGGLDFSASVYCFGPGGSPEDSRFDLLFVW